jgi:glycosyltransferase involved in cell wall biosynthesis
VRSKLELSVILFVKHADFWGSLSMTITFSSESLSKPKVSLGVCVRNCEEYLRDAIESILNQDYPHSLLELIFVDDGSEDGTLSIIHEYVSRIDIQSHVFHTPWRGLGHARNIVVANSKGTYILWVDGDMVLSKDYVGKLAAFMEQNPEVGIAKGKQALESGANLLSTLETYARAAGRMVNYKSEKARSKSLGTGGSIYRIEAIKQVSGFDEDLRGYGEDQDIEIKIRAVGWSLDTEEVKFLDYERHGLTWKDLWKRYWLRGYYTRFFLQKHKGVIKHHNMFPPAATISGFLMSITLYKLTRRKAVFLLPIQFFFKMTGWYIGYSRSHVDLKANRRHL